MICIDNFKHSYYLILTNIIADYEKQVLIIGIILNMQCFIYHDFLQK